MRTHRIALWAGLFIALATWSHASDQPGKVTITRDEWGVPYIEAATDADAAFGLGYAQAEDRLPDLFVNIRTGLGRMSEAFGKDFIDQDYAMRISKNEEMAKELWATAPKEVTAIGDGFIAGVKAYMAEHPEKVPDYAVELHGYQVACVGRAMILNWPLGQIQDELSNTKKFNSKDLGSNEWSVAPSRSADGSAILLTDPHLTWEGLAVFYEAHVLGDKVEMHGFFMVGVPLMALGHNGKVGWAATTGGPDTADVYEVTLNPNNPMEYEYDGEYRKARVEFIKIPVKGEDPVMRPAGFTHLGPLFSEPKDGKAYVGATPYFDTNGLTEQFYRMALAQDTDGLYDAMAMNEYMEQNIMYADRRGNIRYTRVGRVPIRPDGYDWLKAVPGNTSATAWTGIHSIDDLVQIQNPPQGYMTNCNISPGVMMKNSTMLPENYPSYIYNVTWDSQNVRGRRALELLDSHDSVTKEEAISFAMDVYDILGEAWQKAVADALDSGSAGSILNDESRAIAKRILDWDRRWVKDSDACVPMKYLRDLTQRSLDSRRLLDMGALTMADQQTLLEGLNKTVDRMKELYGTLDVTWGDIHRVGRSGKYFPCDGVEMGSGNDNTRTLFDVGAKELVKGSGKFVAHKGSMSMSLMFLRKDGIEAYTCIPWGQSLDPESPHHMDQGEKLYSQRKFKRAYNTVAEIKGTIESTKVLDTGI